MNHQKTKQREFFFNPRSVIKLVDYSQQLIRQSLSYISECYTLKQQQKKVPYLFTRAQESKHHRTRTQLDIYL